MTNTISGIRLRLIIIRMRISALGGCLLEIICRRSQYQPGLWVTAAVSNWERLFLQDYLNGLLIFGWIIKLVTLNQIIMRVKQLILDNLYKDRYECHLWDLPPNLYKTYIKTDTNAICEICHWIYIRPI